MELDKKAIKSLSSDTRVDILKSLSRRRKMPSEIAKEFGLAPSTVVEHLKILENSSLIKRQDTGHKWIYYELTDKGRNLVEPQHAMKFVVILSLGLIIIVGGLGINLLDNSQIDFGQEIAKEVSSLSPQLDTGSEEVSDTVITGDIENPADAASALKAENKTLENQTVENQTKIENESERVEVNVNIEIKQNPLNTVSYLVVLVGAVVVLVGIFGVQRKFSKSF